MTESISSRMEPSSRASLALAASQQTFTKWLISFFAVTIICSSIFLYLGSYQEAVIVFLVLSALGALAYSFNCKHASALNEILRESHNAVTQSANDASEAHKVTSRIAAEYLATSKFLENTQKVANIASWSIDLRSGTVNWSKHMYEILGVESTRKPLTGPELAGLIHPDDLGKWAAEVHMFSSDESTHKVCFRVCKADQVVWIECLAQGRRGEDGGMEFLSGTFQDVTERVKQEERQAFVLSALGIGVWNWDVALDKVEWDNGMYRLYEIKTDQFVGNMNAWRAAADEMDLTTINEGIEQAVNGSKDLDMTFRIKTHNGMTKHILSRGFVVRNAQGVPQSMIGINWDNSKEVELEESLLSERVKMVNSAKMASLGEMSAGVAHEINNPLAIITGKAEMMQRLLTRPQTTPDMLLRELSDIKSTAHRIAVLIKGLRTFSRNSDGDKFAPIKVETLITDTLAFCQERFCNGSVNISVGVLPDLELDCRATQISQILLNLLNNAFDAVHGKDNPWIKISVEDKSKQGKIRFIVTDSGEGIPEAIAEKIMNPFFTTKEVGKGTGLGLSISTGMAQEHGGTLKLDQSSSNTSFILELPLVQLTKEAA